MGSYSYIPNSSVNRAGIENAERSLSEAVARYGENNPIVAACYEGLGTLHEQAGQFALAEENLSNALRITQNILGVDHPRSICIMHALGRVQGAQGKYGDAEKNLIHACMLLRSQLGDIPLVGEIFLSLAKLYGECGRSELAVENAKRAREIFVKHYGKTHLAVFRCDNVLSELQDQSSGWPARLITAVAKL